MNYRLGIGYGRAFQHPAHAGPAGAAEYQDVLAGARYLQKVEGVDANRIGIWGGSYGGYLTGLALARNSDVFKAGVDFHGIANWVPEMGKGGNSRTVVRDGCFVEGGDRNGVCRFAGCGYREVEVAGFADSRGRRPECAVRPDRRTGAPSGAAENAVRGTRDSQ